MFLTRSILFVVTVGVFFGLAGRAHAAMSGSPAPGQNGFTFTMSEDPAPGGGPGEPAVEIKTVSLPQPVCDGFVVLLEFNTTNVQNAQAWSDVVVFWNGSRRPTGLCDATFATIISDSPFGPFPPTGPLYPPGTTGMPLPLANLSVERINFTGNVNPTAYLPEVTITGGQVQAVYTAIAPAGAPRNIFTIISEVGAGVIDPGSPPPGSATPLGNFPIAEPPPAGGS